MSLLYSAVGALTVCNSIGKLALVTPFLLCECQHALPTSLPIDELALVLHQQSQACLSDSVYLFRKRSAFFGLSMQHHASVSVVLTVVSMTGRIGSELISSR